MVRNGSTEHSVGIRLLSVVEVTGVGFRFGTAVLGAILKKSIWVNGENWKLWKILKIYIKQHFAQGRFLVLFLLLE